MDAVALRQRGSLRVVRRRDRRVEKPVGYPLDEGFAQTRGDEGVNHVERRDAAPVGEAISGHEVACQDWALAQLAKAFPVLR